VWMQMQMPVQTERHGQLEPLEPLALLVACVLAVGSEPSRWAKVRGWC